MIDDLIDTFASLLYFGLSGTVIVMVLIRLWPQQKVRRALEARPGMEGPAIAARSRIRERFVYLWACGVFVVLGAVQLIPHERYGAIWIAATLVVLSIMVRMILAIRAGDRDAEEAIKTHPEIR